jgi:hypothetical protein
MGEQGSYHCMYMDVSHFLNVFFLQEYLQQYLDFSFTKDEAKEQRAFGGTALKDQAFVLSFVPLSIV